MKETLVVDLYNILHCQNRMLRGNISHRIDVIINITQKFVTTKFDHIVVVFDGTRYRGVYESDKSTTFIHTEPGQTADAYIEKYLSENIKKSNHHFVVASNDRALGDMAIGYGAKIISSSAFLEERFSSELKSGGTFNSDTGFNRPFKSL